MKIKLAPLTGLVLASLLLAACGPAKTTSNKKAVPTPAASELKLSQDELPTLTLTPREDGHELSMTIGNITSKAAQLEYELLYTASDNGLDIEKGLGDTIKLSGDKNLDRKLLLGTSSCTNGCKYKYDDGVTGGTLTLTFVTTDNASATFELPFAILSAADLKKQGNINLKSDNVTIKAKPQGNDFFVLVKNPKNNYSIFSSGSGKGIVTDISPATLTKADKSIISGDYTTQ
ncbi:hypothetical protein M1116_00480 [Patescibacteria group bacterium]|nr:hypothetical protein [Patescibacteria group bacterium]